MKKRTLMLLLALGTCFTFASCGLSGQDEITVTFKQAGQQDIVKKVSSGETITDVPTPIGKTGYTVVWDTTDFTNLTGDIVVNAVETANTYTITYETNGGVLANETQEVTYDSEVTLAVPTKIDYEFSGWYYGEDLVSDGKWTIADNVTLVAGWEEVVPTYTVTFVQGTQSKTVSVKKGETVAESDIPELIEKTGYTAAWDKTDFTNIQGDMTVTAEYTANTYTITYNVNGGTLEDNTQEVTYDKDYELYTPTHEKSYMRFDGWFTSEDTKFENGTWKKLNGIELTARWTDTRETYSVTFKNGEEEVVNYTVKDGEDFDTDNIPTLEQNKTGYTLTWEEKDYTNVSENIVVNVVATANKYTVTYSAEGFELNGKTVELTYDALCTALDMSLTQEGCTFLGWKYGEKTYTNESVWKVADNVTLTAEWLNKDQVLVKFKDTDGTEIGKTVYKGEDLTDIPTPTEQEGYVVDTENWYVDEDCTTVATFENLQESITVYAKATANTYTITYNANGGTLEDNTQEVAYDADYELYTPTHEKSYMRFDGWYIDENTKFENGTWKRLNDVEVTALWTDTRETYTVTFKNGEEEVASFEIKEGEDFNTDNIPTLEQNKTGYTLSWEEKEYTNVSENIVVNVVATANKYKLTYSAEGFAINGTSVEVTYDALCESLVMTLTQAGYKFLGWKYGEKTYTNESVWQVADNVTLTAEWTDKEVTFDTDDSATVYTFETTVEGIEFKTTKLLNGKVLLGGSEDGVDETKISWISDNEEVVTVVDGIITAVKEGTANVRMKYTTKYGEYLSEPVEVTVAFPTIDKTESIFLDLDASIATIGEQISASKIFGVDKAITKIASVEDLDTDIQADSAWLSNNDNGDEAARTHVLTIYNEGYAYRVKAIVITKIISEYEHLTKLLEYAGATATDVGSYCNYSGYFVLANNIIAPENATAINTNSRGKLASAGDVVNTNGFSGTFDGRGYSIVNANFGAGGLLGDVSTNGIVKNLAIVDATITEEDATNSGAGVLAFSFCGKAENIFVSYTTMKAYNGVFGRATMGGTLKNAVIYYKKAGGYNGGAIASWNISALTTDNVYVVYAEGTEAILTGDNKPAYSTAIKAIAEADITNTTFTGFEASIWKTESGVMPIFESAIQELYLSETGERDIELGMSLTLSAGLKNIAGNVMSYYPVKWESSNEEVATVENGVLTLKAVGTTTITVNCCGYANSLTVNVVEPSVTIYDKTETTLYLETSSSAAWQDQIINKATQANWFATFTPTKIIEVNDVNETDLLTNTNWMSDIETANTDRERTLVLYGEEEAYKVKVFVVTKVITTATELANLINYGTNKTAITAKKNSAQTYSYGGYFVLGGNITQDASNPVKIEGSGVGKVENNTPCYNINSWDWIKETGTDALGLMGFHGTFDGQGYTVDGLSYGIGGVFGGIGTGAVIKNVAFTNCVVDADGDNNTRNGGVLAHFAVATSTDKWTIENVYVQGALDSIGGGMLTGRYAEHGVMNNVVVRMKSESGYTNAALASVASANVSFNNVALIYDGTGKRPWSDAMLYADKPTDTYTGVSEYALQTDGTVKKVTAKTPTGTHVASLTLAETVATAEEFAGFSSTYWTVTAGQAPVFKAKN